MLTIEQLQMRKSGIGGSDAAGVCGVSKWKTPVQIYVDKTSESIEQVINPAMARGIVLEDFVRNLFSEYLGKDCQKSSKTIQKGFRIANVDGYLPDEKAIIEIKTCRSEQKKEWGESFTDQIPDDYLIQVHHYLSVLPEMNKAYVVVLFGAENFFSLLQYLVSQYGAKKMSQDLREISFDLCVYEVQRNKTLEKKLGEIESEFWCNHVLKKEPPRWQTREDLLALFPKAENGKKTQAQEDDFEIIQRVINLKDIVKKHESEIEHLQGKIQERMKDSEEMCDDKGNRLASWKNVIRNYFDSSRFKSERPDLYKMFSSTSTSRRLLF